jgi:hypothetical protein
MAPKLSKLKRETAGLKLYPLFTLMGWALIGLSILVLILIISPDGASYWGGDTKAARDAAEIGSGLLSQLTTLAWWPKLIPPLIFLGVSAFMVGTAMEFAAIPVILDRRTEILARAVPLMGKDQQ